MNFKQSLKSLLKPLLFALAVVVVTALFLPAQVMGKSSFVFLWFLMLIGFFLLSMKNPAINSIILKVLLFSMVVFISLKYGRFFYGAKDTQLIALFIAILIPVAIFYPRFMTYFILAATFLFSSSRFGMSWNRQSALINFVGGIFARGSGKYSISYFNMFLILTVISIILLEIAKKKGDDCRISCNLYKYFWIFNALFFIYIIWGISLGIEMRDIMDNTGVVHICNMSILVFIMLRIFTTEKDIEQLKNFFLGCMLVRGVWAVHRFIFLGGDERNPYVGFATTGSVKITIFDIGDGLIQCIALFYALYMLMNKGDRILPTKETLFYWLIASVGLFNIVFSFRRTGWLGLLLALGWLMINLRREKRILVGVFTIILGLTIFTGVAAYRFERGDDKQKKVFSDILTQDGAITFRQGRFRELNMAWNTIKENIWFGVGPWGSYEVTDKDWRITSKLTHSSVTHIFLKMGVVGLLLYILILFSYIYFWLTKRKSIPLHVRGFAEACFSGFIFFTPNILFGGPIVEFRHMLLLGFVFSIPYITYHLYLSRINDTEARVI